MGDPKPVTATRICVFLVHFLGICRLPPQCASFTTSVRLLQKQDTPEEPKTGFMAKIEQWRADLGVFGFVLVIGMWCC